ncbi:MAG: alpha-amylase family glycosyl hydrolase, partial [Steroidobacteraceae bacterium]
MSSHRGVLRGSWSAALPAAEHSPTKPRDALIPHATYRVQLNSSFTFKDATAIVPYLAQLGISHLYCSPYFRARAGSTHGYDVVDHNSFNPEIGDRADFERFITELREHGMGHVLDIVPNHVGIMGSDNAWWMDVLENGPASMYAGFFDIDWIPANPALAGKVLVPVLGDAYGVVLERGELELRFEPELGSFAVFYHEHRFPLDPRTYPRVLDRVLALTSNTELEALRRACGALPDRREPTAE